MYKIKNNPGANPDNTLVALKEEIGCCGDTPTVCKYSFSNNFGTAIASVVIDGTTHAFAANAATPAAFKTQLAAVLEGLGYVDVETPVGISYSGSSTYLVEVVTDAKIDKFINASAADVAVTSECTPIRTCDFSVQLVGAVGDLTDDGGTTTETLDNTPYAWSGTPATADNTAAQLATDIKSALDALGVEWKSVTATPNTTDEAYDVTAVIECGATLAFGATEFKNNFNSKPNFK